MRRCFYVFDLLMVLIVIATIAHAVVITSYPEILLLDVSVLLRFNTSILLYRWRTGAGLQSPVLQ